MMMPSYDEASSPASSSSFFEQDEIYYEEGQYNDDATSQYPYTVAPDQQSVRLTFVLLSDSHKCDSSCEFISK